MEEPDSHEERPVVGRTQATAKPIDGGLVRVVLTGWENLVAESVGTHRGLQCEGRRIGGGRVPPIVEGALEEPVLRVW